tara:strand:+ start:328 stop:900 length:573 start_codon:yes stop_codon:yes gene_type:complete
MIATIEATKHFKDLPISQGEKDNVFNILNEAYQFNGITLDMVGTRQRKITECNALVSNLLRRNLDYTVQLIGKMFNKHHSTIIHYTKLHNEVLMADNKYHKLYNRLEEEINLNKKKNMYLTVLNFETGRVFQYQFQHMSRVERDNVDSEQWEDFIIDEGHHLDSCQWMVHEQGQVIRDLKHYKDLTHEDR